MSYSVRKTARAIILTPLHEVLLMRMAFPWHEEDIWILPGGGIEKGEDAHSAITREIFEETGAVGLKILGEVWRHELIIDSTQMLLKQRFFWVTAQRFVPEPVAMSEPEMDWVQEYRWWTVSALETANIAVEPVHFAKGLKDLISRGLPGTPIDIDTAY